MEVKSYLVETLTFTFRTYRHRVEFAAPSVGLAAGIFIILHLDIFHQAVIALRIVREAHRLIFDVQWIVCAIQDVVDAIIGEVCYRVFKSMLIVPADGIELLEYQRIAILAKGGDASIIDRFAPVGDDLVAVDDIDISQSLAAMACTLGRIEGEIVGCRHRI